MAPNVTSEPTGVLFENDPVEELAIPKSHVGTKSNEETPYERSIVWRNVAIFTYLHLSALYGVYLMFTSAKWATIVFAYLLYVASGIGITAGAHRLWAHRAYKATWQLRTILIIFNTLAFQDAAIDWARDHRVHHKFSETNADPHNAKRGFFFSHVGWLLCRKHPEVKSKGQGIDMEDLKNDKIVMFQKKYYMYLMPLTCFILPTVIPTLWGESLWNGYFIPAIFRYVFTLNATWLVNSAAHMFGNRPYDKFINPSQNKSVAALAMGEGWHNYHHVFPWDYKTAELGNYRYNLTTAFIDFFAKLGWAYDLKCVSTDMVKRRVQRTGDGTHELWGWGDKDQTQEEIDSTLVLNHSKSL